MGGHTVEEVKKSVRTYLVVFAALAALTVLTVAVSYLDLEPTAAIAVALVIATVKASLVGWKPHRLEWAVDRGMDSADNLGELQTRGAHHVAGKKMRPGEASVEQVETREHAVQDLAGCLAREGGRSKQNAFRTT